MSKVDTSNAPFFDDYDANKKYHKILFRPSRALQIRELNQLQSMLKDQISRMGSHTFTEGALVVPGETNYDLEAQYGKITFNQAGTFDDFSPLILGEGAYIRGAVSGIKAQVITIIDAADGDPITVYFKYTESSTDGSVTHYNLGEDITFYTAEDDAIVDATINEIGTGSIASITQGIYFVRGEFALVLPQTVVLDKYSNTPSKRVGLLVSESVVDYQEDPSLNDNATSTTNFSAPGADRLQLNLTFTTFELDDVEVEDFVEILRLNGGKLEMFVRNTQYSVLGESLARRTYNESGDFVVDDFDLNITEHLHDGTNNGFYSAGDGGDSTKVLCHLDAGLAYVKGFEIETVGNTLVEVNKSRTYANENNSVTNLYFGNYVAVQDFGVVPDYSALEKVEIFSDVNGGGSKVGTARVRNIELGLTGYNVYLFDIRNNSNTVDSSIISQGKSILTLTGGVVGNGLNGNVLELNDVGDNTLLFNLPQQDIKTLKNHLGQSDSTYTTTMYLEGTTSGSGSITFNAPSDMVFLSGNQNLTITQNGAVVPNTHASLSGSPVGKQLVISGVSGSMEIEVAATAVKTVANEKSKTVTEHTHRGIVPASGVMSMGKADVIRLKSVVRVDNGQDVTNSFYFDHGRKENFYDVGKLILMQGEVNPSQVDVTFDYFEHGVGDYFSVDSYSGVPYEDIPYEIVDSEEFPLSDLVDFRPRISDDGASFTGTGSSIGLMPKPRTLFRSDFDYYLHRIDVIYLDNTGKFGVVSGKPALVPEMPECPQNAMKLYTMFVPAYTRSSEDIDVIKENNRRYTMRDIGSLDKRIDTLEYYTSLSLIEQNTASLNITDANGLDRFKNGFMADPFTDHSIGDSENVDYTCSIDEIEECLRPEISTEGIDLSVDLVSSTNYTVKDGIIMLPYTEVELFKQPYATRTMNVNPYAVFSWSGDMKITPSKDTWVDTRYTFPVTKTDYIHKTQTNTVTKYIDRVRWNNSVPVNRGRSTIRMTFNLPKISLVGLPKLQVDKKALNKLVRPKAKPVATVTNKSKRRPDTVSRSGLSVRNRFDSRIKFHLR